MTVNNNNVRFYTTKPTAVSPVVEGSAFTAYVDSGNANGATGGTNTAFTGRRGARIAIPSTQDITTHRYVSFYLYSESGGWASKLATIANGGIRFVLVDGSGNYAGYNIYGSGIPGLDDSGPSAEGLLAGFVNADAGNAPEWFIDHTRTPDISSGTLDKTNITHFEFSINLASSASPSLWLLWIGKQNAPSITGTETLLNVATAFETAVSIQKFNKVINRTPWYFQSSSQSLFNGAIGFTVGNGSTTTNWTDSAFQIGWKNTYDKSPTYRATGPMVQLDNSNTRPLLINQSATDTLTLSDGSIASAAWWQWQLQGSGTATISRVQFWRYNQFLAAHGSYTDCIWDGGEAAVEIGTSTVLTRATIRNCTNGIKILSAAGTYNQTITFSNQTTYDIECGAGGAGTYNLPNISVVGAYTLKIRNNSATNAVTVVIPSGIAFTSSHAGGGITVTQTPLTRGLAFTGLLSGSQVVVYDTGTTTELFRTNSSGSSATWSETATGAKTVDYTIMLAGRLPIRVAGITVTAAISGGVVSTPISQVLDRSYVASSGLIFTTNCTFNAGTKIATWSIATTVQNFYSFAIEAWIAQSSLRNVAFPFTTNGPNSFTFGNDWEVRGFTTAGTGISNTSLALLSKDGLRYQSAAGADTAIFAAINSVDTAAGLQINYQQTDGGTTTAAQNTGAIDQLIQVFGDATHGNFDRRSFLSLKVQKDGFDQAETDVVATYGNLEDQLYIIGLNPLSNGLTTGAPTVNGSPTITDHGASPVTWNAKQFSITITDSAAGNTGTTLMRWIRYNLGLGGTFQGKAAFNWHDLVQTNGTSFKTVRGKVYGDTGAALKGVRVITNAGNPHPDFNLHTADDGTTFAPVFPASATATVLADTRLQLYNVTTSTELNNVFVTGTSYSFVVSTGVTVGDTLRLRACKKGRLSGEAITVWSAAGATFLVSQPEDTIYTAWGIDGATVTEYSLDGPNIQIDANDVDGSTQKIRLGAYFSYALTLDVGIRTFFGAITALAASSIRINVGVANLRIDNTNATTPLVFTDVNVRLFRSDGSSIIAPVSYTIHSDYNGEPFTVETGVSGLTGPESSQLLGLPSAVAVASQVRTELTTELGRIDVAVSSVSAGSAPSAATVAAAVLAAANATPIAASVEQVNGVTIQGSGTALDPMRPA